MSKEQIVTTLTFYSRAFSDSRGNPIFRTGMDEGDINDKAERIAWEMLRYESHALWPRIEEYFKLLSKISV